MKNLDWVHNEESELEGQEILSESDNNVDNDLGPTHT
jgi:hypothetical protein